MFILELIITILFYLFLPFYFVERVIHKKSYGWKEKFGNVRCFRNDDKIIHIHCCSVGETLAVENLLKTMRKNFSGYKIVVTTFTYAGQQIAQKKYSEIADYITYFPFDIPKSVNKFLSRIKPDISIITETEIWPYYAYSCKKHDIPLIAINARISDKSYGQYKYMKWFFSKILRNYSAIYAQSQEDAEKFISIGMKPENTARMGNLKFDVECEMPNVEIGQKNYRILLAGSTHKPENEIVISAYKELREKFSDAKLLIAPRHLERVEDIKTLLAKYRLTYGLRSKAETFDNNRDVVILDTLGELSKMYSICYVAFIGGSFNKTGGHNPLEAAIFEKPVVSGPSIFNFKDIYETLCKAGAAKVVSSGNEFIAYLKQLFGDEKVYDKARISSKNVFDSERGAIDFVINRLKELL